MLGALAIRGIEIDNGFAENTTTTDTSGSIIDFDVYQNSTPPRTTYDTTQDTYRYEACGKWFPTIKEATNYKNAMRCLQAILWLKKYYWVKYCLQLETKFWHYARDNCYKFKRWDIVIIIFCTGSLIWQNTQE